MEPQKYIRKPLYVEAVRVTDANMSQVAKWCEGTIVSEVGTRGTLERFIKVEVRNALDEYRTRAYSGRWVLKTDTGYKVYTNNAFHSSFDLVQGE